MRRDKWFPFLVSSLVCLRSWLGRIACLENCFMDHVPGCHGDTMSAQRFQMRACSLPLYWPVFHPWCCCFPWIRSWVLPFGPSGWEWICAVIVIGGITLTCVPELI